MAPVICAWTATVESASAVPMTRISSGIAFRTTGATVTSTAVSSAEARAACTGAEAFEQPAASIAAAATGMNDWRIALTKRLRRGNGIPVLLGGWPRGL